jgi:hypothetical protein
MLLRTHDYLITYFFKQDTTLRSCATSTVPLQ